MHPGRTAEVILNGEVIGFIGQVHPTVQKDLDIKETYIFELSLKALAEAEVAPIAYQTIPRYPINNTRYRARCGSSYESRGHSGYY